MLHRGNGKLKRIILIALALASASWAGTTSILLGTTDLGGIASSSVPTYLVMAGNHTASITEADSLEYLPPGTLSHLRCDINQPPTPGSFVITVRVGAADTSITCSIGTTALSCVDNVNTAAISTDPRVSIKITPSSTPSATQIGCSLFYQRT